jgi:O-antigen biosynthesis protein
MSIRDIAKRWLPTIVKDTLREHLLPPPEEDLYLHDYQVAFDPSARSRLSLIIPTIATSKAFGGVMTALELFLELGKRTGVDLRIVIDNRETPSGRALVDKRARALGLEPENIEIVQPVLNGQAIAVRRHELFMTFNWWITLNLLPVLRSQQEHFEQSALPFLYLIQEYEPQFYPFSTTHMLARSAFEPPWPCWGIFNTVELFDYFTSQGHRLDRSFVFEPKLSDALRPFLTKATKQRARRIVVYGRPGIPRNCFSALLKGLRLWSQRYPEFKDWEVLSVGLPHRPFLLGDGRKMRSIGKLSLEAYAELLRETAVGVSLMSSPHPSYPPLEMAHFGVLTITNRYANKDLSSSHGNIISLDDIRAETIGEALALACRRFEENPGAGEIAKSSRPAFLAPGPFDCIEELAEAAATTAWKSQSRVEQP